MEEYYMSDVISKRSELLFLYDVKDINPNGDPLDENKPRIDEETMENLVSDVRLKRTVRDYLCDFKGHEIFIRGTKDNKGVLKDKEDRLKDLNITNAEGLLKACIDIRLFGATTAIKGKSIHLTGPVQFRIGRSLHRVKLVCMKGSTVMPSNKLSKQGTFTEHYVLPYSLICFYGVVNENAAKTTLLTTDDVHSLVDALWNGTKNQISRSKVGQMPRLLINVTYREKNYHIGDLNALVRKAPSDLQDEEIRDITQVPLEVSMMVEAFAANAEKIDHIDYCADPHLCLLMKGKPVTIDVALKASNCPVKQLTF